MQALTKIFKLSSPLKYQSAGNFYECKELDLFAPTRAQYKHVIKLKQAFYKAQQQATASLMPLISSIGNIEELKNKWKDSQAKEEAKMSAQDVISSIYQSDIDIEGLFEAFELLCSQGSVKTGDERKEPLTKHMLYMISDSDFDLLLGEYIAFFIPTSMTNNN